MKNEVFQSRKEAARRLAGRLCLESTDTVILAIPTRGILVGHVLARELGCDFDIVVPEKIPIPWNPEAAMGAISADGSMVFNQNMVKGLGLSQKALYDCAVAANDIARAVEEKYRKVLPPVDISGRRVILVDDGISSGYTMLAAIESVISRSPARLSVATPVSSIAAARLVGPKVDEFIALVIGERQPFLIEEFYLDNTPAGDDSMIEYLALGDA